MKSERITVRISEDERNEINLYSEKYKMKISEFVYKAIKEKMETEKLSDSQERFLTTFDIAYKKSSDTNYKQLMVILNRIEFNTRWLIKLLDIFMNYVKVPQTKDQLSVPIIDHPITELSHELIVKDIRKMSSRKHDLEDE